MSPSKKNHFGVSNAPKGYVGHPDDLLTSIFGFYAFFIRLVALIKNIFQGGAR